MKHYLLVLVRGFYDVLINILEFVFNPSHRHLSLHVSMRMPMPPACEHVCSNVSINASAYRFVYTYANVTDVYPNGAFCQPLASPAPLSHISLSSHSRLPPISSPFPVLSLAPRL